MMDQSDKGSLQYTASQEMPEEGCEKTLTISIAAYNVSATLEKTLNSLLLEESYLRRLEILIVDDGSTDNTLQVADVYRKKYPESIRILSKENGGYGSTINASLSVARGKYYKLLDGDDWFDQDGFKGLMDFLDKTDADLVISPYWKVGREVIFCEHVKEIPPKTTPISEISFNRNIQLHMHGLTVKTKNISKPEYHITEHCFYTDNEFVFQCIAASDSIVRFDTAVYCYRIGEEGQSVSIMGMRKHFGDCLTVLDVVSKSLKDCDCKGTKKDLLEGTVSLSIYWAFCSCLLSGSSGRSKMILMEEELKRKSEVAFMAGMRSNLVRIMRKCNYHFFGFFRWYVMKKHKWK